MAARVVEVCRALEAYIKQEVTNGTYGFTFNVLYQNPAYHRLESTVTSNLYIYPGPEGPTTATRSKWMHTYNATLHLIDFIDDPAPGQTEIDNVFLLMENIVDSLKDPRMAGMSLQEFSTEDNPEELVLPQGLQQLNLAQSVRRATYMELR